ncbi:YybH family protein [Aestuariibius sp. 2305UL40-4]|uniref:YybH family protein n=1 Tax=Aestuariibius violaceus TaxID=3234132 RepID=UPI00345F0D94
MTNDREKISALCQRLGQAHHDKDADAIIGCYAPDAVIYSLAPPLRDKLDRDGIAAWLATWDGPVLIDADDVDLVVSDGIAWSTALNRIRGTKIDGTAEDIWFRTTMCFRKTDGDWRIAHDHSSTPYYMDGSLKAAVDLSPAA